MLQSSCSTCMLPKFKIQTENDGFEKESPFPGADFQVACSTSGGLKRCELQASKLVLPVDVSIPGDCR